MMNNPYHKRRARARKDFSGEPIASHATNPMAEREKKTGLLAGADKPHRTVLDERPLVDYRTGRLHYE
jgi:hypothetical protein